jgi:glycosyltransferase involved in cell wall biosynthesis
MVDSATPTPVPLPGPVSILMPVCNEAEVIEEVIEEWVRNVFQYLPPGSEMVFDDGASTDGTREILERMVGKYPFVRVLYDESRDGFAAAARRLYRSAKCPWVFFTDSDGQYVARDFWKLAEHVGHYDVIHGAKIGRKDPLLRRIFSALFNKTAAFLFEVRCLDINSAFRLMKTRSVLNVLDRCTCMPTLLNAELLLRSEVENHQIKQVAVTHRQRRFGRSRGLPPARYLWEGLRAVRGLLKIKASYRT